MRWEVVGWGALALVLFAAEAMAPGAFMLWIGIGAAAVFLITALVPGIPVLWQVVAFVVLSVVAIQAYRRWGRTRGRESDKPLLNRRSEQLVGRVAVLQQGIVAGQGRVSIDDASWQVTGPELAAGTRVRVVAVVNGVLQVEANG
ncbi:NfeD family protein [Stenotrophomonas sp. Sa5BUN4]|jgi:membrane protein implicated in regulation of membrane protease activity|uniref:NfeD family protein n=1 Tax=Stenotrophomonas lacuserhaii TaxID=2760084 RepID=A0A8X8G3C6_9GAMM|nr:MULTISPECIES: NfeD family protein [Stenotrophomonas]KIP80919.1 membrane protein [Stenotrophomonas maltophilia]MBD7955940.1 NfeD family protein [Stenotrophomonas pennii]MDY1033541.1 NfeD family protein [Stenotrophomonas sp. CFBP8980]